MTTIFAPLTAIANSSVSIIRISGSKAVDCLKVLGVENALEDRKANLCKILNSGEFIDQVLITYFKGPNSFTGDDVVEINTHASIYVVEKIMGILSGIDGVRMAEAGEFSKIAFLNGKMDLIQAEAIVDLINSETKEQHRQALRQMGGDLSRIYEKWRLDLINIMANLEAFIDFPDEDLPIDIVDDLESKVSVLRLKILAHLDDGGAGIKIRNGLSLAIIGQVNVGKSSLINYLAKSDVAIVTDVAGTTRDVVEVHLQIAGLKVIIADTAGIRQTNDVVEKEGVKRSLARANEADLKILVVDGSKLEDFDEKNLGLLDDDSLIVINKADLQEVVIPLILRKFDPVVVSLKSKVNVDELINCLEKKVRSLAIPNNNPLITRARYREALVSAADNLLSFSLKKNVELASEDLRMGISEIAKISGKVDVDDILDVVFSGFCIGK
jgi:tRNA modification GTPase